MDTPLAESSIVGVAIGASLNGLLPVADGLAVTLRVCVMSFRTHRERIDALLEDLDLALDRTTA